MIAASPEVVYAFAADPDNLTRWAAGLAQGAVVREGDSFLVDSPMGRVTVTFVPHNGFGIIDHDVALPSGEVVNNPVRVIAHPEGAEIVFTIRQLALSDDDFLRDAAAVERDLDTLKNLIEQGS
ncbi:SRPBCC family protein [Flexivirga caeni]|uniref:SRPBCC family protein n=1 Tax=Flexivirga caeni TaxID=2294115 RepID=UPI001FED2341|nr:SRPBCC family protein [Flexivirga caeni]